jgi:nitrate/nitrite-specific signal transduction histidine kinase
MRERASLVGATLQLESSVGKGTSVFLRRPTSGAPPATTPSEAER